MDDNTDDTLDTAVGPKEDPGSQTGMETTVSGAFSPEEDGFGFGRNFHQGDLYKGRRPVDLSFLSPSNRAGSLGRIGEYEIVAVLGRGAMGIVLKGFDRGLDRHVAIKVQDPCLALNRRARAKFLREARAVAAISDPRVVTIHKVNAVKDQPYLVMEYIAGTLRDKIKAGTPLKIAESIYIAEQIALGLVAAHTEGVLHRDIKPANILLDGVKRVKISDFGLAVAGLEATAAASTDRIAGTPGFMSPEQTRGEDLDARSDLFSLGCVVYMMFTGKSPFPGNDAAAILWAVCHKEPEPLPVPNGCPITLGVASLVTTLLSKDRDHRPSTAKEVAENLAALRSKAESHIDPPATTPETISDPGPETDTEPEPEPEPEPAPAAVVPPRPIVKHFPWSVVPASLALVAFACLFLSMLPPARQTWTVGRSSGDRFPDLASALRSATPGTRLILSDPGPYLGPFLLDDPNKFRDLTIESSGSAILSADSGDSVVAIYDVTGVTLKNIAILTKKNQFAVDLVGKVEGTTFDGLKVTSPDDSLWTQIYLRDGASGTQTEPIVISDSTFQVGHGGITIEGSRNRPIEHVVIRNNQFGGDDEQVHVLQNAHHIAIKENIFVGGQPLTFNLGRGKGRAIAVVNNTFLQAKTWLHPAESHPDQEGIEVCNNAILESSNIDAATHILCKMARGSWNFHHNFWEPTPKSPITPEKPLARTHPKLEVMSRDANQPGYLQPAANSELAKSGAGGNHPEHVGAIAPAGSK